MIDPWERQAGEGVKPFEAFAMYRDMGSSRSIREVARQLNKSASLIGRWSSEHRWADRCAAWDAEQDRIAREEIEIRRREMVERHANLATTMLARVAQGLRELDPKAMNASQLARMADIAAKLERLSRGEPDSITEERVREVPATPEEVKRFLAGAE